MNIDEEIEKLSNEISVAQRRLSSLLKSRDGKKSKAGKNLVKNFHNGFFRKKEDFDFVVEADGGSSCNNPTKGYGVGYGSYRIETVDDGVMPIKRLEFGGGISVNAAEVLSIYEALKEIIALLGEFSPSEYRVLVRSDSMTALNNVQKCKNKYYTACGSESFVSAVSVLQEQVLKFSSVQAEWRPREFSVTLFGH